MIKHIKHLDEGVEFISNVARQEQQRLSNESYLQFLAVSPESSSPEKESINPKYIEEIRSDHKKLSKSYGDSASITKRADELLQNRNYLSIAELVILFAQIVYSVYEWNKYHKLLKWYKEELQKIENSYVNPVIQALRNNERPDMNKVNNGLFELKVLKKHMEQAKKTSSSLFWNSVLNFSSSGLNAFATFYSIAKIGHLATTAVVNTQYVIGFCQGGASIANLLLTALHGYNWLEFNNLLEDIGRKVEKLEEMEKKNQATQLINIFCDK